MVKHISQPTVTNCGSQRRNKASIIAINKLLTVQKKWLI